MDSYKILYQGVPASGDTLIYTVPERSSTSFTVSGTPAEVMPSVVDENVQTMVTQIALCDTSGSGDTVNVHVAPLSATVAGTANRVFSLSIAAGATERKNLNWPMGAGNTIRVVPTTGSRVTITLWGIEVK